MFVFDPEFTFPWPVKVKLPGADGEVVQEFTAIFRMPADEKDLFERPVTTGMAELIDVARDRLSQHWVGWEGINVVGGTPLPFSPENRDQLLRNRPVRMALDQAFGEAVLGIREKN